MLANHCLASFRPTQLELVPNKTLFPSERTYHCPVTSDLLPAVVYENGHRFTRFQGRMKKLLGTIDADRKTAAPPVDSKLKGLAGSFGRKAIPSFRNDTPAKPEIAVSHVPPRAAICNPPAIVV